MRCVGVDAVPPDVLAYPADAAEEVVLVFASGVVVRTGVVRRSAGVNIGIVLAPQGNAVVVVGIPSGALKLPTCVDQPAAFIPASAVMVISAGIETIDGGVRPQRRGPLNPFVIPANAREAVAFACLGGLEMLARVWIVESIHRLSLRRLRLRCEVNIGNGTSDAGHEAETRHEKRGEDRLEEARWR